MRNSRLDDAQPGSQPFHALGEGPAFRRGAWLRLGDVGGHRPGLAGRTLCPRAAEGATAAVLRLFPAVSKSYSEIPPAPRPLPSKPRPHAAAGAESLRWLRPAMGSRGRGCISPVPCAVGSGRRHPLRPPPGPASLALPRGWDGAKGNDCLTPPSPPSITPHPALRAPPSASRDGPQGRSCRCVERGGGQPLHVRTELFLSLVSFFSSSSLQLP